MWDRLVGDLVDAAHEKGPTEPTALSIVAVVDGLALRLINDTLPNTRRDAERALDTLLMVG